jgi:hypothetical protein
LLVLSNPVTIDLGIRLLLNSLFMVDSKIVHGSEKNKSKIT